MSEDFGYIPPNDKLLKILDRLIGQNAEILNFNFVLMRMLSQPIVINQAKHDLTIDPGIFERDGEVKL